ncbi:MAG: hypothetical protein PIR53_15155 [Nocardioides alkalitolerans]
MVRTGPSRRRAWTRVTPGVHRSADAVDPFRAGLVAWQQVLPRRACFTGLTAARLRGWWLPELPTVVPVFAAVGPRDGTVERRGLVVQRLTGPPPYELDGGLRVADRVETLRSAARWLGVLDLVVLVDGALAAGVPREVLDGAGDCRRRGVGRLRTALQLADAGAESAWETLLRVLHVVCDVPVRTQHPVVHDDVQVAGGDLWITGTRTLQEYDGAHHRESRQQAEDLARQRRLTRVGWTRNGYVRSDVLRRAHQVLRDADRALGRPHDPDRLRAWFDLLRGSGFSAAGRAELARAWARPSGGRTRR